MAEETTVPAGDTTVAKEFNNDFSNMKFPNAFVHRYEMTAKDGTVWNKAFLNIPQGTRVNGVDVGGFAVDAFMTDYMVDQFAEGKAVTYGVKKDELVTIFKGKGEDRQSFEVDPISLAKGLKENREDFASRPFDRKAPSLELESTMEFPRGFAHFYEMTAKDGKVWDKVILNLPTGLTVDGVDVSDFAVDTFAAPYMKQQALKGEPVTYAVKEGDTVELFKGKGEDRKTLEVNPEGLAKALQINKQDYASQKAAERAAAEKAAPTKPAPARASSLDERGAKATAASQGQGAKAPQAKPARAAAPAKV